MSRVVAGDKPRLLMVDDSRTMRSAASKMLGKHFDVVVAEDGEKGWQKIRSDRQVQVVFTDIAMPELDGYGLLERIRTCEDPGIARMPVIVVTGAEDDEAAREQALRLGATDFIAKPFNSTDLVARARAHANYQRERQQLEEQVTVDSLTGLGNRNHFMGRLKQELAFSARHGHPLSLVRADVDHFNKLFIRAGKEAADGVLQELGSLMARLVRKEDTAARIGLAQFAIALPTADAEGAAVFAERLCRQVREAVFEHEGRRLPVTLSVGVMTPEPHPGQTPRAVLEEANLVLAEALKAGGDRYLSEKMVREMDEEQLPSPPEAPPGGPEKGQPEPEPGVDEALSLLAAGEEDKVRRHLPALRRRLRPLLRLMEKPGSGEKQ